MNPDHAQSVVARCLTDPEFLLRAHDRSLSELSSEGTAEDIAAEMLGNSELERLLRFRGFITKVKHNALRRRIPATLGLMGGLGVELLFFCNFSQAYVSARREGPLDERTHLDLFSEALSGFLSEQPEQIATPVAETFAHELLLFDLGRTPPAITETEHMRWQGAMSLVPKTTDIIRISGRLGARDFTPLDVVVRRHTLCYWRPENRDSVSIFEVDALTAAVFVALRAGGGPEETRRMLAEARLSQISPEELRAAAVAAARRGFVELRGEWLR
ncbi:hypothetical protein [Paracoccus aminovorans]|uniref:hypothetical protein n=1 Tax=Paracoccus aminovorans TaxID=34004 RepID=UPI000B94F33E|nr:hypothetical protein [Paracoccus aminovorans]CQR85962.1 hypothetical protein JCM7685_1389 [Paracoccus aminovorans]